MSSKTLGNLIRACVVAAVISGLFLCIGVIPSFGWSIVEMNPEFSGWFWPWLLFAWLAALPCFALLVYVWKVSGAVMRENVFTLQTARWVKTGAILLLSDAALLFGGNVLLLLLNMNHPGVLLLSVIGVVFVVALGLAASVLSRYLTKASALQEESDGTL